MKKNNNKGFTLMEMLIVVAIIAILIAIAIPTFTNSLNKAKDAADEANGRALYAAVSTDLMLDTVPSGTTATNLQGTSVSYNNVTYTFKGQGVTNATLDTTNKTVTITVTLTDGTVTFPGATTTSGSGSGPSSSSEE